jgi:hypothetical protein
MCMRTVGNGSFLFGKALHTLAGTQHRGDLPLRSWHGGKVPALREHLPAGGAPHPDPCWRLLGAPSGSHRVGSRAFQVGDAGW